MRRDSRNKNKKTINDKILVYSGIGITLLAVVVFALFMYSKSLSNNVKESTLSSDKIASIINNTNNSERASSSIGKSVEEAENKEKENTNTTKVENNNVSTKNNSTNVNATKTNTQTNNTKSNGVTKNTNTTKVENTTATNSKIEERKEVKKELNFVKPVEGEISREFAKDNLIYSETLQEWVTHMGIDIKADKTTVVKAAEAGTVKSIKNDPRYGITIVIEHQDGFQTVYANLLTTEFVVEGEKVEKGQSIGTVGNTAIFEIADEAHLHFEILKDSVQVDPSLYIK
jgi:murein DD-endopeptidase MepM/ murein hydrolase activator NlpD